jgi:hypothetical protein
MIRNNAKLFKLFNAVNDKQLLIGESGPLLDQCPNPECKAKTRLSYYAHYTRFVIDIIAGVRAEKEICVPRFICPECGSTHASIPFDLIPYGSYSIRFIIHVLRAYLMRAGTVNSVCKLYEISLSTLYGWIDLFNRHMNEWLDAIQRFRTLSVSELLLVKKIDNFTERFLERFKYSFLQHKRRC